MATITDFSKYVAGITASKTSEPNEHGFDINTNSLSVTELNWLVREMAVNFETLRSKFNADLSDVMLVSTYVKSSPADVAVSFAAMQKSIADISAKVNAISTDTLTHSFSGSTQSVSSVISSLLTRVEHLEKFTAAADAKYAKVDGTTQFPKLNIKGNVIEII